MTLSEKGKKVKLSVRSGEEAIALVLDGCVFRDDSLKCDALYLFHSSSKRVACMVELKGAGDIPHAFAQLAYVKHQRPQYQEILEKFNEGEPGRITEKAFIITNGSLPKTDRERLEKQHLIRVTEIIHCEASSKIPDLRTYLFSK